MKKLKKYDTETLGGRLKGYESKCEIEIPSKSHICVRIDGHHFSSYTKGFMKPFDYILSEAFRLTSMDLLKEFNAVSVYTQSDEISLIIPSLLNTEKHKGSNKPLWKHAYTGRVQKMASLISAFTTMRFNKHLEFLIKTIGVQQPSEYFRILKSKEGNAWFDARVFGVDSDEEAFNTLLWRIRDCQKNSKSVYAINTLAQHYFDESNSLQNQPS